MYVYWCTWHFEAVCVLFEILWWFVTVRLFLFCTRHKHFCQSNLIVLAMARFLSLSLLEDLSFPMLFWLQKYRSVNIHVCRLNYRITYFAQIQSVHCLIIIIIIIMKLYTRYTQYILQCVHRHLFHLVFFAVAISCVFNSNLFDLCSVGNFLWIKLYHKNIWDY